MALPNLFSRRQRQAAGPSADVYTYDKLPNRLRVQITQVWEEAFGLHSNNEAGYKAAEAMVGVMRKELGVYELDTRAFEGPRAELFNWFLKETELLPCLDAVELGFRLIDRHVRDNPNAFSYYTKCSPDEAIAELNARFLEAAVGYQYEGGALIRVDAQLMHSEVVRPTISLLQDPAYAAANGEFMEAHRLYRSGDYEKSLTECCKAFESVLKVIIQEQRWTVTPNATAKALLDVVFANGLVPEYAQGGFNSIRSLLEGSIATIRNRSGGHGAGTTPRAVSQHLAAYQIHQTAAAILYLIQAERALP